MESCADLLSNDHSGRGLKALKDELFEMDYDLKRKMDQGLSSSDIAIAKNLKEAVEAAQVAVDTIYKQLNG